jgi:hypothetical protein
MMGQGFPFKRQSLHLAVKYDITSLLVTFKTKLDTGQELRAGSPVCASCLCHQGFLFLQPCLSSLANLSHHLNHQRWLNMDHSLASLSPITFLPFLGNVAAL